jgi:polyphosphate kinase
MLHPKVDAAIIFGAHLNCVSHLLSLLPYTKLRRKPVQLPERVMKGGCGDQAVLEGRRFVENRY